VSHSACRRLILALVLGAAVATPGLAGQDPPDRPEAPVSRLRPGMTQTEVRRLLGPPPRSARQILYRRYLEQWVYDAPQAVRIEFDCIRGQEPQILTVQPLSPAKP
jgi:hypothetical protein